MLVGVAHIMLRYVPTVNIITLFSPSDSLVWFRISILEKTVAKLFYPHPNLTWQLYPDPGKPPYKTLPIPAAFIWLKAAALLRRKEFSELSLCKDQSVVFTTLKKVLILISIKTGQIKLGLYKKDVNNWKRSESSSPTQAQIGWMIS